ncbi:hypothetical protein I4I73_32580 [Pseudonocardia sp. KRD-184]|uniref:ABM domain-containing protein n=1 Tax=Pseudonocardia oceani TaxID=2792013 RepID=A0ABS6UB48_9PSEU|nr:hypothetical protein [Pseudonocardia oceani]MBW0094232.1 hypothetical protein [Pseudonocardia oceani]MBW0100722.1 hypothetical protein [Pseudonocardia oceani]MBW0113532.1 hypothetical protein [Pseudonocardia oceani]MBW0124737.1 hypothetical protein [Pseudonocardia oceani]MBW0129131.1 hypothetical protein [Pseudonocardia oceani]
MSYVTVVDDSPAGSIENLDRLMTEILPDPDGLAARYAGVVGGKLCIVAVWDSREHAETFMERDLGPGLRQLLGSAAPTTAPTSVGIEVEHSWAR